MNKKLFLSFSQLTTFLDCERFWFISKIERLRPKSTGSALVFGGAIDSAVEHILLKKEGDYKQIFLDSLSKFNVNGKDKTAPKDVDAISFFVSDIQENLLRDLDFTEDFKLLELEEINISEFLEYCKQQRKIKQELNETEQKLFNLIAFRSLEQKGLLIIEALKEWIAENVAEVHEVQKKIEIDDGNGNKFIGYLDFILTLKDGRKLLIDLKTSSDPTKYYPEESASQSQQLGIYAQETGIMEVGYLVAAKKINVREPRVKIKFVEGVITEDRLDDIFGEIENCVIQIREKLDLGKGAFDQNKDLCFKHYGGKCPYVKYCHSGDKSDLEKV